MHTKKIVFLCTIEKSFISKSEFLHLPWFPPKRGGGALMETETLVIIKYDVEQENVRA
jgi:hypothetical protein